MKPRILWAAAAAALVSCASPAPNPVTEDPSFGQAVAAAKSKHLLYPAPKQPRWDGTGMEANAAVESINRYWDSFKAPPPTFVIIPGAGAAPGGGGR